MKYKAKDRVEIQDKNGEWHKATIYNANAYREPCLAYAVDVDGIKSIEPVFCGEEQLRPLQKVEEDV